MVICSRCKISKDITLFYKNKSRISGLSSHCKQCCKDYYMENREEILIKSKVHSKLYKLNNKDIIKEYNKIYRKVNRHIITEQRRTKRRTDAFYNFICSVRTSVNTSFRRGPFTKKSKTCELLGCDFNAFRDYIESKFTDGMCWERWNEIHLDHIIPLATATTEKEVINLCHYTNYQPLWAIDNFKKGSKILNNEITN